MDTRGVYCDSPSESFLSHSTKKIENTFDFQETSVFENFQSKAGRGHLSRFTVKNILSHSIKIFCRRTLLCFRKFLVSKDVKDDREGRVTRFSVEIVFSLSTETCRGETLLCFQNFRFRKLQISWIKKGE